MHLRVAVVPALLLLACNPKPADTDADASTTAGTTAGVTEGAEATSATNTAPTSGADTTSGPGTTTTGFTTLPSTVPTNPEDTASGSATSGGPDTGDETGGNPGLPGACAAVCMHWDMCEPGSAGPVDECTANCSAGVEIPSPCAMASAALANCVAALPCEEALKFLEGPNDRPTSCLEELKNVDAICGGPDCGGEITGGGGFCEFEQECDGLKQNYACDLESNTCTCTENDVPGKQCPEDGLCAKDRDEQLVAVEACCGWQWM
jgi:hypothetical protein